MPGRSDAIQKALLQGGVTLGAVLTFTALILVLAKAPPLTALGCLLSGSVGSWVKIAQVLTVWVPLTLCACGLLYTFRIGLWNIGVEGQVVLGAIGAMAVLRLGVESPFPTLFLILCVPAGMASGSAWAVLAGLLKTRGGVSEIFGGLGLNFVAQSLTLWLIFGPWKRAGIASMSGTEPLPSALWFPFEASWRLSPQALLMTVLALGLTGGLLHFTRLGLLLRAIGGNPTAARLFGVSPSRYFLLAMILGGGLAGLAGVFQVAGVYHRLIPSVSSSYGYLGLLVVMLAHYRLAWIPPIAFFFAALNVGSIQLPLVLQLDSSLSGVIQGALVLITLMMHGWKTRRRRLL